MRKKTRPKKLDDFDAWGSWLRAKVSKGEETDTARQEAPPLRSRYGALRYFPYGYLYDLSQKEMVDKLIAEVGDQPGPTGGGAMAVLRLIVLKDKNLITAATRSRVAAELEFALKHNIEPTRILGFLYEVGSQRAVLAAFHNDDVPEAVKRYRAD